MVIVSPYGRFIIYAHMDYSIMIALSLAWSRNQLGKVIIEWFIEAIDRFIIIWRRRGSFNFWLWLSSGQFCNCLALYPWHAVCGMRHVACSSIVHWPFSRNVVWGSWRRIPIRTVPGTFSLLMLLPDGEREEERGRRGDSRSDVLDYVRILTAKSK